ncbi:MAG: hypothetical protein IJ048_11660 [Clostridia bacterium]|nr:hypothetical protein [Clostridia bacterium]
MALVKCPRCELNYILDGGTLCTVCRREVRGEHEIIDTPEMCSECGENPAVPGSDLCMFCLKEMNRRMPSSSMDDAMVPETSIGIDSVSTMDEIELDIVDDAMASEFGAEDEFKDSDEEEEPAGESDILSTDALADDEAAENEDDSMDDDE